MRGIWTFLAASTLSALGGCATLPDFLGDTATYGVNPNQPVGASINMERVRGNQASVEPLRTEPGNVWPSEIQKVPTLQELEKEGNGANVAPAPPPDLTPFLPGHTQPRPAPGSDGFGAAPQATTQPNVTGGRPASTARVASPGARPPTVPTNQGAAPVVEDGAGFKSVVTPQGNAILVPNGNGTNTLIKPDGSIETVPATK